MSEAIFKQIKNFIKQQILDKTFVFNDKIPTESELSIQFKTTRQTVNKALSQLAIEGWIRRFPRSGSFVCFQKPQTSILELRNIVDEIQQRGNCYSNKINKLEEIKASVEVAAVMGVVTDQKIFTSQIIHQENDVPVRFDVRYINPALCPDYLQQDFKKMTPNEYLQKRCPAQKVENTIEAVKSQPETCHALEIGESEPCLAVSRVVFCNHKVASYSKLYYPSSRYKLYSVSEPVL